MGIFSKLFTGSPEPADAASQRDESARRDPDAPRPSVAAKPPSAPAAPRQSSDATAVRGGQTESAPSVRRQASEPGTPTHQARDHTQRAITVPRPVERARRSKAVVPAPKVKQPSMPPTPRTSARVATPAAPKVEPAPALIERTPSGQLAGIAAGVAGLPVRPMRRNIPHEHPAISESTPPTPRAAPVKAPVNKFVFKPATPRAPSSGPNSAKAPTTTTRDRSSPAVGTPKVGSGPKPPGRPSLPYASRAKKDTVAIGSVRLGRLAADPAGTSRGDTLGEEVDALFDGAVVSGDTPAAPGRLAPSADTEREIRKLFGEIASHHAAQLRDFFVELSLSPTSKRWADICSPALASIRRAAEGIAHEDLSTALQRLEKTLDDARRGSENIIADARRDQLLEAFAALTKLLPEAFDLKGHRARRDPIIVHTLLEQVPGMSTLAIDRIYAAGLSSLEAFYGASASDLAATTGVSDALCTVVLEHFTRYRTGRAEGAENAEHGAERARLKGQLDELAETQSNFRSAELQENAREKRRLRAQRAEQLRNVSLALAHLGQVKLIEAIERMPVDAKIQRIGRYLRDPAR